MLFLSGEFFRIFLTALLVIFLAFFVVLGIVLIDTMIFKNKMIRSLKMEKGHEEKNEYYAKCVFDLVSIKTTSYETGEAYHLFREKVKSLFPLVHQYLVKEKIGGNAVFTYKSENYRAKKVLFVTHMDTTNFDAKEFMTDKEVYGSGTFDSKALLFSMFQSVEETLTEHKKLDIDLTIVMTVDDHGTKEGNERIVNTFLKRGNFFNLVIEEGIGIIDPTFLGIRSNYALIGIGVTGAVKIRYRAKTDPLKPSKIDAFLKDIKKHTIFKSQIDSNATKILHAFAKDMPFVNRMLFRHVWLFRPFIKRIINADQTEISKLLKTDIRYGEKIIDGDFESVDLVFELATHDTTAEIVRLMQPFVDKHKLQSEVIHQIAASKVTPTSHESYKKVCKAIEKTYKNVFFAPYIITKISEHRRFTKVSDGVIRFSPLYYPYEAVQDAQRGNEHIMKKSLYYGITFFKEIINSYKGEDNVL